MQKVAFLGAGSMGRPMIRKLLESAYGVAVYDIDQKSAVDLIAKGATWAENARSAVKNADFIITCLPMPEDVRDVMNGPKGAFSGMRVGSIWIDTSTTDYHITKSLADEGSRFGIESLEAPASNLSHMGVDFANVSFYVGGSVPTYLKSKELLGNV